MNILLIALCVVNVLIGSWLTWTLLTINAGPLSIDWTSTETLIYILSTALAFLIPALCWTMRRRWPAWLVLLLAVLPLALLLTFTDFRIYIRTQ